MVKIDDFGNKIGGSKKELWKLRHMLIEDLLDMSIEEKSKYVKKENVWKKPDYNKMVEDGMSKHCAYFIKKIRDALPASPVFKSDDNDEKKILAKQEGYIRFLGEIRDYTMDIKTDWDISNYYENFLSHYLLKSGYYVVPRENAYDCINNKLLKAAQTNLYALENEVIKKQFCYTDEEKLLDKFKIIPCHMQHMTIHNEEKKGYLTIGNFENSNVTLYIYPEDKYLDESAWIDDTFFIVGPKRQIIVNNLETYDDALSFVKENCHLDKPKKKGIIHKKGFVPAQLSSYLVRNGPDYRCGYDISGEDMIRVFSFNGGEFGNWLSNSDRQQSLNFSFDAFNDLAKALKISQSDISLYGQLSIAFGSRGKGGRNSAAAHYEPLRKVINLTKMKGARNLAHEWGHALDDIISKLLGNREGGLTDNLYSDTTPVIFKQLIQTMMYKPKLDENGVHIENVKTDFYKNSIEFDSLFAKSDFGYWQSEKEMFARAFACYVKDKLEWQSDYLCGHADTVFTYVKDEKTDIPICIRAYPIAEERENINQMFDTFIEEIKHLGLLHNEEFLEDFENEEDYAIE